jgi:tRNA A-37 threonylcarbamoyl transferase component Bud32
VVQVDILEMVIGSAGVLTSKYHQKEARLLQRCRRAGVNAPAVYYVDQKNSTIYMEYIDAITVRDHLNSTSHTKDEGMCPDYNDNKRIYY